MLSLIRIQSYRTFRTSPCMSRARRTSQKPTTTRVLARCAGQNATPEFLPKFITRYIEIILIHDKEPGTCFSARIAPWERDRPRYDRKFMQKTPRTRAILFSSEREMEQWKAPCARTEVASNSGSTNPRTWPWKELQCARHTSRARAASPYFYAAGSGRLRRHAIRIPIFLSYL